MKETLADQIAKLQKHEKLPEYISRKRDFPFVTEQQIERGAIIYIPLSADEGLTLKGYKSRDKWIVIVGTSEYDYIVGSLLMNTEPNSFSKELEDIQFPLLKRDYKFLDYRSWLDCSELFRVPCSKILKYGGYCGKIKDDDWELIWKTIKETEFISDEDKEEFGML